MGVMSKECLNGREEEYELMTLMINDLHGRDMGMWFRCEKISFMFI